MRLLNIALLTGLLLLTSAVAAQDIRQPAHTATGKVQVKLKNNEEVQIFEKMEVHEIFGKLYYFFKRSDGATMSYKPDHIEYFIELENASNKQERQAQRTAGSGNSSGIQQVYTGGTDQNRDKTIVELDDDLGHFSHKEKYYSSSVRYTLALDQYGNLYRIYW